MKDSPQVTVSLPKHVAFKLKELVKKQDDALIKLGILSVQFEDDQIINLQESMKSDSSEVHRQQAPEKPQPQQQPQNQQIPNQSQLQPPLQTQQQPQSQPQQPQKQNNIATNQTSIVKQNRTTVFLRPNDKQPVSQIIALSPTNQSQISAQRQASSSSGLPIKRPLESSGQNPTQRLSPPEEPSLKIRCLDREPKSGSIKLPLANDEKSLNKGITLGNKVVVVSGNIKNLCNINGQVSLKGSNVGCEASNTLGPSSQREALKNPQDNPSVSSSSSSSSLANTATETSLTTETSIIKSITTPHTALNNSNNIPAKQEDKREGQIDEPLKQQTIGARVVHLDSVDKTAGSLSRPAAAPSRIGDLNQPVQIELKDQILAGNVNHLDVDLIERPRGNCESLIDDSCLGLSSSVTTTPATATTTTTISTPHPISTPIPSVTTTNVVVQQPDVDLGLAPSKSSAGLLPTSANNNNNTINNNNNLQAEPMTRPPAPNGGLFDEDEDDDDKDENEVVNEVENQHRGYNIHQLNFSDPIDLDTMYNDNDNLLFPDYTLNLS